MRDILYLVWHYLTRLMRTHYPTVVGLIVISVVLFLSEIIFGLEFRDWCFKSPLVRLAWSDVPSNTGLFVEQTFKLLPPLFLHGGPEHIFGNMIFLWTFGCLVADYVGPWWTVFIYLFCGACGNLLHVVLEPKIGAIGASGAVAGLEGVYFTLAIRWALKWPDVFPLARPVPPLNLAIFAAIGIAFDIYGVATRANSGIAYGGHIGGFASGILLAMVITQLYRTHAAWQQSGWAV